MLSHLGLGHFIIGEINFLECFRNLRRLSSNRWKVVAVADTIEPCLRKTPSKSTHRIRITTYTSAVPTSKSYLLRRPTIISPYRS